MEGFELISEIAAGWRELRRQALEVAEIRMTPEVAEKLDSRPDSVLTTLYGMPVVIDDTIPPEPGFEIRHRHHWSDWVSMALTSHFPMRRWCLAGGECTEQQTWLAGEPEPKP